MFGFIAALNNFFDPIPQLSQLYTTYQSGMAALDKIFGLLDQQPEIVRRRGAARAAADPRRADLRHVSFRYRRRATTASTRVLALADIDL